MPKADGAGARLPLAARKRGLLVTESRARPGKPHPWYARLMRSLIAALLASAATLAACAAAPLAGDPPIGATLDEQRLGQFARQRMTRIRACYEAGLGRRKDLRGTVEIGFTVLEDGRLDQVRILEDQLPDRAVGECVVTEVAGWRTPFRPSKPTTVSYPFVFGR